MFLCCVVTFNCNVFLNLFIIDITSIREASTHRGESSTYGETSEQQQPRHGPTTFACRRGQGRHGTTITSTYVYSFPHTFHL